MKTLLSYACCFLGSAAVAATNLVSNTAIVTNRVQGIVTYTMSNGVARVQDPSGKLIGTAEERALKVAAEGQVDIASAAADAAGTAMEEWREFTATTDVKVVYIDAGFTQDLPALAPNLCGWVAGSFYDREKGEDHYYVWFNREIDAPPSMCARSVSESGTNWLDGAWKDWAVTNWIDKATGREWTRPYDAEVEYLESHGTERIDTGIRPSSYYGNLLSIRAAYTGGNEVGCLYGAVSANSESGSTNGRFYQLNKTVTSQNYRLITSSGDVFFNLPDSQEPLDFEVNANELSINGKHVITGIGQTEILRNLILFARSQANNIFNQHGKWRVYAASYKRYGSTLLDFVPVRVGSVGYMFDRASGHLFRNAGTGEFAIGGDTGTIHPPHFAVPCRELVVPRRNANCVLKTGTVITLGGRDGFDADIHKVNIEVGGTPTVTTSAQFPLFYAVTRSGTNTVTRAYTNGFLNVENGFVKEPTND